VSNGGGAAAAIGVSAFTVVSDTQITATFSIPAAATLGGHNVAVVTPGGTTGNVTFTVTGIVAITGPAPALTTGTANTTTKAGLVTISNGAAATGAITLNAVPTVIKTAGPGTFSIIAGGSCTASTVLNPGQNCTVNVQYAPGGSTTTSTAHVEITGTGFASPLDGPNFNGN
jgi:hypothetical protein